MASLPTPQPATAADMLAAIVDTDDYASDLELLAYDDEEVAARLATFVFHADGDPDPMPQHIIDVVKAAAAEALADDPGDVQLNEPWVYSGAIDAYRRDGDR